jgi:MerR family transcriptional regulator, light-induced transcriptional regulator
MVKNLKDKPVYPMRTVVRLTGVGPHKLRFWEGRYGLISPSRTSSGHRLYSKRDLDQIKAIAELVEKQGFSLVAVKEMLEDKMARSESGQLVEAGH